MRLAPVESRARTTLPWRSPRASARAYAEAGPLERIAIIRRGVPATYVTTLVRSLEIPKDRLCRTLGLSRSTVDRKARQRGRLSQSDSERVLAIARLIGQADRMVQTSGDPSGFEAAKWLGAWLYAPHPVLGCRAPSEFMDTAGGCTYVSNLLAQQESGAYG